MSGLPKNIKYGIIAFIAILVCRLAVNSAEMHPSIKAKYNALKGGGHLPLIIRLSDNKTTKKIYGSKTHSLAAVKAESVRKSGKVAGLVKRLEDSGHIKNVKEFWICEAIYLEADKKALKELDSCFAVKRITPNFALSLPDVSELQSADVTAGGSWGLGKINAPDVWSKLGLTGRGVRIGHLDTGVDISHPALEGKLLEWAEFDSEGKRVSGSTANDSGIHGTHTAGIIVGGDTTGNNLGVAPGAGLLSAKVVNGSGGSFAQLLAGMEWVVDPDGDLATDDGADVLNISLGVGGLNEEFIEPVYNLISAGIIPVVAVGNSGPGSSNSPANVPDTIAVGSTSENDSVSYFSSGETVEWDNDLCKGRFIKPDFSAPGSNIYSAGSGGGYLSLSGTSMAAPFVTGTIALMLEEKPELTLTQIKQILKYSSEDLGDEGKDTRYGWGRIDALEACMSVVTGIYLGFQSDGWEAGTWAYISTPASGESVRGDAVSIIAVAGALTRSVSFEYSADGEKWELISETLEKPYTCYWNSNDIPEGEYLLRVRCENIDGTLYYSGESTIYVTDNQPVINENGPGKVDPLVYHVKNKRIMPGREAIVATAEGTCVIVPEGLFADEKVIRITTIEESEIFKKAPPAESNLRSIGIFRELEFEDGTDIFPADLTIIMPYVDKDDDGIVDGTGLSSSDLGIYYLKEENGIAKGWVKVEADDSRDFRAPGFGTGGVKSISAQVDHFTLFAIFAEAPRADLNSVIVYPNPVSSGSNISFDGMSANCDIKIYDLLGHMIKNVDNVVDGSFQWDLLDSDNGAIANGIYFYLVTDDSGSRARGKFAVAR